MENEQAQQDLATIRGLMERSSKFLSLSGLSGILAGVYALTGAFIASKLFEVVLYDASGREGWQIVWLGDNALSYLIFIALIVLIASIATGFLLSLRKARKTGQPFWGPTSKALLFNMSVPLITGGLLMLLFVLRGEWGIVAPASLIFYGISLVSAGNYTFKGVQYLGINQIILGLLAACYPGYGLLFWAVGFGLLHIIYGSVMYFKYDR